LGTNPVGAASLSANFKISAWLTCPGGNEFPRTITRQGDRLFSVGTIANKGSRYVVNQVISRAEVGAAFAEGERGTNSSEVTDSSIILKDDLGDFVATKRITLTDTQSCEVTESISNRYIPNETCRSTRCSIVNE
jgi:hypothetical protein